MEKCISKTCKCVHIVYGCVYVYVDCVYVCVRVWGGVTERVTWPAGNTWRRVWAGRTAVCGSVRLRAPEINRGPRGD